MVTIKVDKELCDGCGECVDICPEGVWGLNDEKAEPENIDACVECCSCVEVCPQECINHSSC
ncbi:MAG: 4Fe-4S binding protein [Methanobacteriota archaeon]